MTKTVTFYFDVGSPAAYLAATQLPTIAKSAGATVDYRPFLLGGVFKATGNRPPLEVPAKGTYLLRDLTRYAERYGVPFRLNPFFPINTLPLMRVLTAVSLRTPEKLPAATDAVFGAIWVDGKNVGDKGVAAEVLGIAGFAAAELMAAAETPEVKDRLRTETDGAVARGVFGAPTMFVGDEMLWGQDRLDFVREMLERKG